jgi:hypothetical protein
MKYGLNMPNDLAETVRKRIKLWFMATSFSLYYSIRFLLVGIFAG